MRHRAPHFQHIFSATAIRPAITAICGRKCSTPTASRRSRRAATSSIPSVARRLEDFVYAAGGSRDYDEAYGPSAAARRRPRPYSASGGSKSGCWLSHGLSANLHRHRRRSGRRWLRQPPMLCRVHGLDDLDRRTRRSSRSNSPPGLTPGRVRRDSSSRRVRPAAARDPSHACFGRHAAHAVRQDRRGKIDAVRPTRPGGENAHDQRGSLDRPALWAGAQNA